jgi:hypothetical protein
LNMMLCRHAKWYEAGRSGRAVKTEAQPRQAVRLSLFVVGVIGVEWTT